MNNLVFNKFIERVKEDLKERIGNVPIHVNENIKNNGIKVHSVTIINGKSNLMPCIYVDEYFEKYINGKMDISEISNCIIKIYEENILDHNFDISKFIDYNNASIMLRGRLVNTEKNLEMLKGVPHREFLDLSLVYVVELELMKDEGEASIRVTNEHMKLWNVTEKELYEQVKSNMDQFNESSLKNMREVFCEILGCKSEELMNDNLDDEVEMYVLTNKSKINGAVELINENLLKKFALITGRDFVILPSSIHECLLVPFKDERIEMKELAQMVREVNDTQLAESEILSYHVYKYELETGKIAIVA